MGARGPRPPRRPPAPRRPAAEKSLGLLLADAGRSGIVTSAHDLSDGGLAQSLVESCLRQGVGATVSVGDDPFVGLFSESTARALVTVPLAQRQSFVAMAEALGVPVTELGRTGGDRLVVEGQLEIGLDELRDAWTGTLPAALG